MGRSFGRRIYLYILKYIWVLLVSKHEAGGGINIRRFGKNLDLQLLRHNARIVETRRAYLRGVHGLR